VAVDGTKVPERPPELGHPGCVQFLKDQQGQVLTQQTRPVVVVTGASGGIGRATARAFAASGADVGLIARGTDGLTAARREVEAMGRRALALSVDVSEAEDVEAAADRIERELGPIDVWVNNAMVTVFSPFKSIRPEEFRRVTEVTYLGTVFGTRAALKHMRVRDRGTIVQVGSALAYRAIPLQSPYCGAKFAVRGFTDAVRCELLHHHSRVRLTMVQLCAFNTPQFDWAHTHLTRLAQPVPPIFQPEVAAEAIVWAARARRREIWVGFPSVRTIIAQWFAPGLLDRLAATFGYRGQLTNEPLPDDHRDNLFAPVPGDHGAHGRFDTRARRRSWQLWLDERRGAIAVIVVAVLVLKGLRAFL
jgi:NAD(P)-dependent dehydrogenase (short-subunit alcohol dehydrogenase family)